MRGHNKAEAFQINDYTLIPGTELYHKTLLNARVLLNLEADRVLYNFRVNAGLPVDGIQPLEGWESPGLHFRGHFTGHYLTACLRSALTLQGTDPKLALALRRKAEAVVDGLAECQEALGQKEEHPGYLAAVESSLLDDLEQLNFTGIFTVVYYNLHKIMCGLLDAWLLLQNEKALNAVDKMADYIAFRLSKLSDERIEAMIETRWYREDDKSFHMEFGGMAEVLLRLYGQTGKAEHLALAGKFDRKWFRRMLWGEKDMLGHYSLHANTEIPCVIGLAEYQDLFGDEESRTCVDHFMDWLKNGHMLPTGGVSGRSAYTAPADYGGELFEFPHMYYKHTNYKSGESCCSHNLNVLARKEFGWTADCSFAQEHERRFVNAVLAQQHPVTGGFVYNLGMAQGSRKNHSVNGYFCCNGTGLESHAWLTEGSFFHMGSKLWLTGYVPCDLKWEEQGAVIEERTDFPVSGRVAWTLRLREKKELTIYVRIPEWAGAERMLMVNGVKVAAACGCFVPLERVWEDGDRIEAVFPFELRSERMEDRPEYTAVFYGPHLLAACTEGFAEFNADAGQLLSSLKPGAMPCEFETELSTGKVVYRPICNITDEVYNAYTIVAKPVSFHVVDMVVIGNAASEREHDLRRITIDSGDICDLDEADMDSREGTGEDTEGIYRYAEYPYGFSYRLHPEPRRKLWLRCRFKDRGVFKRREGEDGRFNQCFRLEIDDGFTTGEIAVQTLNETEGEPLTDVYYPVMERESDIRLRVTGCRYEGAKRGTGRFYNLIELGYFEE